MSTDSGTPPFRIYANDYERYDDVVQSIVRNVARWSHADIAENLYKNESGLFKWKCFCCRRHVMVDIVKFNGKQLFCDKHKPKRFNSKYKNDVVFMQFVNALFNEVRITINKNTNHGE